MSSSSASGRAATASWRRNAKQLLTGEWIIDRTNARQRRILHYWLTILWFTVGLVLWIVLRDDLWFVGFMSLYAIWITHLAVASLPLRHDPRARRCALSSVTSFEMTDGKWSETAYAEPASLSGSVDVGAV